MIDKKIEKVAVVGSGLIGSSWATLFAKWGNKVNVYDVKREQLESAKVRVKSNLNGLLKKGFITEEEKEETINNITYFENLELAVKDVQFIQECSFDDLDLKRNLVAEIDKYNSSAIISSSTSKLNISDISRDSKYPERCIGGHPYIPPHLMPIVEMTKWEKTDEECVKTAYDFYKSMKKEPVVLYKESPGFIGNRLQYAYLKEAFKIVMEGVCSVEDLDKVSVYALGIRWAILGPNLTQELKADGGFADYMEKLGKAAGLPIEYKDMGVKGIAEEMANRSPEIGNNREGLTKYRDDMLMKILKLHNKI